MSSVETGQMSAVETGQMSAAETGHMFASETRHMYAVATGLCPASVLYICLVSTADICLVSTADICPVSAADTYPVSTADVCPVSTGGLPEQDDFFQTTQGQTNLTCRRASLDDLVGGEVARRELHQQRQGAVKVCHDIDSGPAKREFGAQKFGKIGATTETPMSTPLRRRQELRFWSANHLPNFRYELVV